MIPKSQRFMVNAHCIIPGPFLEPIFGGSIAIESGKILGVGSTADIGSKFADFPVVNASNSLVMPGLFNSHTHVAMGFFRGLGHGRKNMVETFLFPAEKNLTAELLEPLSYSYIYDGLRSGVTSFVDHYYFSQPIGLAFERFGVRAWLGETIADLGGAFPGRDSFDRARKLIETSSYSPRIRHTLAPHAADTVSRSLLREVADYAKSHRLPLHMHLSQSQGELDRVRAREGVSAVEFAEACGALTERSLVVHLTSADSQDLAILAGTGATLGWCPSSTVIYDRLANVNEIFKQKIPVALGTDCPASSDHADMLSELRTAALFARHCKVNDQLLSPDHILAMSTTIPAATLGVLHNLGTIAAGKQADLIFLDIGLSSLPIENPLANAIYSMGSRDVRHVMIDGNWVLWNREASRVSIGDMTSSYQAAVSEIQNRVKRAANA